MNLSTMIEFTFSVACPETKRERDTRKLQLSQSPINEMRLYDCDKCIHSIFGSNIGQQHIRTKRQVDTVRNLKFD